MDKIKHASLHFAVKAVDAEKYQLRGVFSTADEDRHGEIVDQKGWKLDNFLRNPVILWGHDQSQPAIGKAVDIGFVDGNLEGTIQFAAEEYDFAMTIFKLYAGGYLSAFSVGFMNTKWQFDEPNEQIILLENELYEVSCVNVPANAMALAKSKGVDISPLEKRIERRDKINAAILAKDAPKEEAAEVPADAPADEKPKEEVEEETTTTTDNGQGEATAPTKTDETEDEDVKSALETLVKASPSKIKEAVAQLTGALKEADKEEKQVDTTPAQGRKISKNHINRVIRTLLASDRKA